MRKPNFKALRSEMDGYLPEGEAPSKDNIEAFLLNVCRPVDDAREGELETWDDVLELTYGALAFFRVYYCGECPSTMPSLPAASEAA